MRHRTDSERGDGYLLLCGPCWHRTEGPKNAGTETEWMYETPKCGQVGNHAHVAQRALRGPLEYRHRWLQGEQNDQIQKGHSRQAVGCGRGRNQNGCGGCASGKYSAGHSTKGTGHKWLHQAKTHAPKAQPGRMWHRQKGFREDPMYVGCALTSKGRSNRKISRTEKETALLRSGMSTGWKVRNCGNRWLNSARKYEIRCTPGPEDARWFVQRTEVFLKIL